MDSNFLNQSNIKNFIYQTPSRLKNNSIFFIILLIGVVVRICLFSSIPAGLNQDEAAIGYDAYSILNYGIDRNGVSYPIHLISWGSGQNALYAYLLIPFIYFFGLSAFTIRLVSVVFGIMSIVVVYLFANKVFDRKIALISMFLIAINPWHIMLSRWALESNILPFFILLGVYFLSLSMEKQKFLPISFGIFAISLYAYGTAYLFVPVFLLLISVYLFYFKLINTKIYLMSTAVFGTLALPIFLFVYINKFKLNPINFFSITIPRLSGAPRFETLSSIFAGGFFNGIFKQSQAIIQLFITQSDGLLWNTIPRFGFMYLIGLPFLIAGLILLIMKLFKKNNDLSIIIIMWFSAACLIGLSITEININRLNIIFIPVIILISIALDKLSKINNTNNTIFILCIIIFLFNFSVFSKTYFVDYKKQISEPFFESLDEAINYASENTKGDIYVTGDVNMPYIFVLFYREISPKEFSKTVKFQNPGTGFQYVHSFGRYLFIDNDEKFKSCTAYIVKNEFSAGFDEKFYNITSFKNYSVAIAKTTP